MRVACTCGLCCWLHAQPCRQRFPNADNTLLLLPPHCAAEVVVGVLTKGLRPQWPLGLLPDLEALYKL